MDRFFLKALVEEIGPRILGRRVRMAAADRGEGTLALSFDRSLSLVWSFLAPEASGPYLGGSRASTRALTPSPGLKKSVIGARVTGLEIADLDRIVTLSLEHKRLSGRTSRSLLVLEVFATRVDLYLVDSIQQGIVEVFSSAPRSRLGPGELYRSPRPPPTAAPLAADGDQFERRLVQARSASGALSRRQLLLAATGFTPLLVREMEWILDVEKRSERDAFERLKERLGEKKPALYAAKDPVKAGGRIVLASPIRLRSETHLAVHPLPDTTGFSGVLAEAVALALGTRRLLAARGRLEAALSKRLGRVRRLRRKLLDERASFGKPEELRQKGEKLLAALSRARRTRDRRTVVVPDLFQEEEKEIVLEIDPRLSLPANAERFFSQAKKASRAGIELSKRIAAVEEELSYLESFECDLANALEAAEMEQLEEEAREEGRLPLEPVHPGKPARNGRKAKARSSAAVRLPPREFLSHRGHRILVGRSARSNEETTFRIAGPDDLWLHAEGAAGAHVVLRLAPGGVPDEREIEEAAGLAAYFSKRRNDTAVDVLVTERRHVAKMKGAPRGLVKVSRSRTVRVAPRLLPERKPSGSDDPESTQESKRNAK